jgi:TonB family protein
MISLRAAIAADGSVEEIRVLSGSDSSLNALAAETLRRWKFRPALLEGQPVRVEIVVSIPAAR